MGREKRAEERDSRQMIRNVANDILDDMVGCGGGCAVTWEKVRVRELWESVESSAVRWELRTGNTHPRSKQVPRIDVQKQWSVGRRGSGVESWRTAVMGGGGRRWLGVFLKATLRR